MIRAIVLVRPCLRLLAKSFGSKARLWAAAKTFALISSLTEERPLNTREAVLKETPASLATSFNVVKASPSL
jgi:hypothetical protein